jgi:hypothetical protein
MRGKQMVDTEVGLKSIAHNLRKMRNDILRGLRSYLMMAKGLQAASTG